MKFLRNMKPIFVENSKIPVWLSKIAPLKIGAICMGPIIFCRGEMSDRTKRHETIHFQQCLDLLFIGLAILYAWDWLHGLIKYRGSWDGTNPRGGKYTSSGNKAYYRTRAEQEAYNNEENETYLGARNRYQWLFKYSV